MANKVLTQTGNQVQSDLNFVENLVEEYRNIPGYYYNFGDVVRYNDELYVCKGTTSESWDSTKWTQITLPLVSPRLFRHEVGFSNDSRLSFTVITNFPDAITSLDRLVNLVNTYYNEQLALSCKLICNDISTINGSFVAFHYESSVCYVDYIDNTGSLQKYSLSNAAQGTVNDTIYTL